MSLSPTSEKKIIKVSKNGSSVVTDTLAVEDPLLIKFLNPINKDISITMRTPGQDAELAAGFLFTEGILTHKKQIAETTVIENEVHLTLNSDAALDLSTLDRHFYTNSSCGVCGKSSLDSIKTLRKIKVDSEVLELSITNIYSLKEKLDSGQSVFKSTGGIHAAALFSDDGELQYMKEDVGRHNALDKVIGHAFLNDLLPLNKHILLLSGRASFELIQKAYMAGIQCIAAVGAPSNLAVNLAEENDITLIGFLSSERFNIYTDKSKRVLTD